MGGCRCTFRKCENSTASRPGMHFFHFPIRDWERLEKWAAYADKDEFKDLPVSKLKNKVVCEEHFRNNMFMNYLREGLVKTAVPTLEVLENGQIWDLETDEVGDREEWVVPGGKSLTIVADGSGGDPLLVPIENDSSRMEIQFLDSAEIIEDDAGYGGQPVQTLSEPLILNKVHKVKPVVPVATVEKPVLRKVVMKRKKAPANDMPRAKMQILSIQRMGGKKSVPLAAPSPMQVSKPVTLEEVPSATMPSSSTDVAELERNSPPVVVIQQQPAPEPTTVPIIDPNILEKLDKNSAKIDEVKKLLQDVLNRPVPEPKVITVPVPTPVAAAAPPPPAATPTRTRSPSPKPERSGPNMNKVQLFNGIKRYLNPTMVALLRCEMFGGASERQWKPDERTLAVELLNLGESVYDHFCDEFRFRLPPKKDARKWKEQNELDDDDAS